MSEFVPASSLAACGLRDLGPRQLFFGLLDARERFLSGHINGIGVLIMIAGEEPFFADEQSKWSRPGGFAVGDIRFEIDLESVVASSADAPLGSLTMSGDGLFLWARSKQNTFPVLIDGPDTSASAPDKPIAFRRWRIVHGPADRPMELFKHGS